jgi:hypothetical protein
MTDARVVLDDAAIRLLVDAPSVRAAMSRVSAELVREMKRRCPVSKQVPVYAIAAARAEGRKHRRDRVANPVAHAGDFPLRPSGYLRSSIRAVQLGDGSILIGPHAKYAEYVVRGTIPHEIVSHGPWPLRNRETGRVFGPHVHHPGTRAVPFPYEAAQEVAHRYAGRPV